MNGFSRIQNKPYYYNNYEDIFLGTCIGLYLTLMVPQGWRAGTMSYV